jgi:hypothetical protein
VSTFTKLQGRAMIRKLLASLGIVARSPDTSDRKLWECVVGFEPRRGEGNLEHGDQRPGTRLCLNPRRHDRLPSVRDHDDITGLEVRHRMLEEAQVVAGCVVETIDRHRAPSIDRLAVL